MAVWGVLRLYTPTWESTAVILLGGLCPCVLVRVKTKVDHHRIVWMQSGYQHGSWIQFFVMTTKQTEN